MTTIGRSAVHLFLALAVALVGLMATSAPATAAGTTTPVVVGSPSEVPAGAVEDVPSQYQTPGACDTTRSWTLTVPPSSKQQYRHPLEKRTYTPAKAETSHQEYKYKQTTPAVQGVKEYVYKKAAYKTQHWARYQKHVAGRIEKRVNGTWYDTGSDFGWTRWEGDFWNTTGSFQVRDWADAASPDVIGEGGHGSMSDEYVSNGYTYRWTSERYSYRVIERQVREVPTGTYVYTDWTTQVLGAPWEKVDERWRTAPQPEQTTYYNGGNWTRDVLGAPWVKYDERKVVDSAAVPASFSPWTFDAWTAWSDSSAAPADPDGQSGEANPLNLRRVGTPMQQQTVETAAGYTQQYFWSDGKDCVTSSPTAAAVTHDCSGWSVTLNNSASTVAVPFTVTVNGLAQEISVPAGGTQTVTGPVVEDSTNTVSVAANGTVLQNATFIVNCVGPATTPPTTTPTDTEVLEEEASGRAVGSLKVSCQGTVRVTMRNRSSERADYKVKIADRTHKISVASGKTRKWVASAAPRDRAQLWLGDTLLASKRLPRACAAPEVLPDTGQRG